MEGNEGKGGKRKTSKKEEKGCERDGKEDAISIFSDFLATPMSASQ